MKILVSALLILPGIVLAEGGLPTQPYIYVEGRAEIEKPADMVTLRFELVARNADQTTANQEVQAKAAKIFAMLNGRNIAEKDVVAGDLRSEPQYQDDENSPRNRGKLTGYAVTRNFTVKVRELPVLPKLVDELIAIGGIEFSGIDARLAEEKEIQDEVWDKALTNAREHAEKTLKPIAPKIDSVFAISPVAFPEIQRDFFGSGATANRAYVAKVEPTPDPSQYRLAPVTISQSVHVIYLISPTK